MHTPNPKGNGLYKLEAFRCALDLYRVIGEIVREFPRGEAELRGQMKRASRSVTLNIAEGVGKRGRARIAAYEVALGEAKELFAALDCAAIDGLASSAEIIAAQGLVDRMAALLTGLIASVERGLRKDADRA